MNAVEYGVILPNGWEAELEGSFFPCREAVSENDMAFNLGGVLMVRKATDEEFDLWVERQDQLRRVQDMKMKEALEPVLETL